MQNYKKEVTAAFFDLQGLNALLTFVVQLTHSSWLKWEQFKETRFWLLDIEGNAMLQGNTVSCYARADGRPPPKTLSVYLPRKCEINSEFGAHEQTDLIEL